MPLHFRTVRLGSPRQPGEGLRIGTVRFLPRGVPKSDYAKRDYFDVWLPTLAPSKELWRGYKAGRMQWSTFADRYRSEMGKTTPRQTIQVLAELAKTTPLSVGCYCGSESFCHRSVLRGLIREAAGEPARRPLSDHCIYTIAKPDFLDECHEDVSNSGWNTEGKRWTSGLTTWHEAQQAGEALPVLFADATDCSRLIYWGLIDFIELDGNETRYGFSELQRIRGRHSPQELVLASTGEKIAPGFIRPYALVQRPSFIRRILCLSS